MKRAVLLTVAGACALYLAAPWVAIVVMACIAATLEAAVTRGAFKTLRSGERVA